MLPHYAALIGFGLAVPSAMAGCGSGSGTNGASYGTPTKIVTVTPDASDAGLSDEIQQGSAIPQTFIGSPLCHSSYDNGCYPDVAIDACELNADGGSPTTDAGSYGFATPACHVVASGSKPGTACSPAGFGLTNAACSQSAQCAAAHECIGAGSCRRYCCGGTSSCQVNEFCDVQPTAQEPATIVPVCMPEVPCLLFDDGFCPANQQCSIVREDGTTSCVNVGGAKDGESCVAEHCARGLVCIGAQDAATCAPLCYTSAQDACASTGRKCIATLPLFRSAAIGVCQ